MCVVVLQQIHLMYVIVLQQTHLVCCCVATNTLNVCCCVTTSYQGTTETRTHVVQRTVVFKQRTGQFDREALLVIVRLVVRHSEEGSCGVSR